MAVDIVVTDANCRLGKLLHMGIGKHNILDLGLMIGRITITQRVIAIGIRPIGSIGVIDGGRRTGSRQLRAIDRLVLMVVIGQENQCRGGGGIEQVVDGIVIGIAQGGHVLEIVEIFPTLDAPTHSF